MKSIFFLALIILISSCTHSQTDKSYKIDPSIESDIESNQRNQNGMNMGSMDVIFYENGEEKINTFKMDQKVPFITMAELNNDTINIKGFAGFFVGFGFNSIITKSNSQDFLFVKTDDYSIYKLNKSDTKLYQGLNVPCKSAKLTLTDIPNFKLGDTIKGIIEITSENYFKVDVNEYYFKEKNEKYKGKNEVEEKGILKAYFVAILKDWSKELPLPSEFN